MVRLSDKIATLGMRNVVERAFELAPECTNATELKKRLSREGYDSVDAHIGGLGTRRQLKVLFRQKL